MKQDLKSGSNSTNIQAAVVNYQVGMDAAAARELFIELWRENMPSLAQIAKDTANVRAERIREELLAGLADGKGNADGFTHPEKQLALLQAQTGFAISGDDQLRTDLVAAMLSLSKEPERSFKAIVLSEAIKVLPSLTRRQISAISTGFTVRFVSFNGAASLDQLLGSWERFADTSAGIPTGGDLRHLEYCGCAKRTVFSPPLVNVFKEQYPGLVSAGHSREEMTERLAGHELPSGMLMMCMNDPTKVQIAALNEHVFKGKFDSAPPELKKAALAVMNERPLDDAKLSELVTNKSSFGKTLLEEWGPVLQHLELTSVGMAVGHSHAVSVDPNFAPLDIWLS